MKGPSINSTKLCCVIIRYHDIVSVILQTDFLISSVGVMVKHDNQAGLQPV